MKNLLVHDLRWRGRTPPGNYAAFDVDETTPLDYFVTRSLHEAAAYQGDVVLIVFAHGLARSGLGGGFGITFCREGLRLSTIGRLAPLAGHIHGGIVLFSCEAAHIAPGRQGMNGDGNMLCSRLAQITRTSVTASTATQYASLFPGTRYQKGVISPNAWEGAVLTYGPSGEIG